MKKMSCDCRCVCKWVGVVVAVGVLAAGVWWGYHYWFQDRGNDNPLVRDLRVAKDSIQLVIDYQKGRDENKDLNKSLEVVKGGIQGQLDMSLALFSHPELKDYMYAINYYANLLKEPSSDLNLEDVSKNINILGKKITDDLIQLNDTKMGYSDIKDCVELGPTEALKKKLLDESGVDNWDKYVTKGKEDGDARFMNWKSILEEGDVTITGFDFNVISSYCSQKSKSWVEEIKPDALDVYQKKILSKLYK